MIFAFENKFFLLSYSQGCQNVEESKTSILVDQTGFGLDDLREPFYSLTLSYDWTIRHCETTRK